MPVIKIRKYSILLVLEMVVPFLIFADANGIINNKIVKKYHAMSNAEKQNIVLELELDQRVNPEVIVLKNQIEENWNNGNYDIALAQFQELETALDSHQIAVAHHYIHPLQTSRVSEWGDDIRISDKDSVIAAVMDVHCETGNLFAAIQFKGEQDQYGQENNWAFYISTDHGQTWSETFWWVTLFEINAIGISVVGNHCYVGYGYEFDLDRNNAANIRRFRITDGANVQFDDSPPSNRITVFTTSSDSSIKEIVLTSNQDSNNDRLYYLAITEVGDIFNYWSDQEGSEWEKRNTGIHNADRGLDVCFNNGSSDYSSVMSFIDINNDLNIYAKERVDTSEIVIPWVSKYSFQLDSTDRHTGIGAYSDTMACIFEYSGSDTSVQHCRIAYCTHLDSGWTQTVVEGNSFVSNCPDITVGNGGEMGFVYRFEADSAEFHFNCFDSLYIGSKAIHLSGRQPYNSPPTIKHLGNGDVGVVFLWSDSSNNKTAFFKRGEEVLTGIHDLFSDQVPVQFTLLQNYPNPFNPTTKIGYFLPKSGKVKLEMLNLLGQCVEVLVDENQSLGNKAVEWDGSLYAGGVYFCRLQFDNSVNVRKMILVK